VGVYYSYRRRKYCIGHTAISRPALRFSADSSTFPPPAAPNISQLIPGLNTSIQSDYSCPSIPFGLVSIAPPPFFFLLLPRLPLFLFSSLFYSLKGTGFFLILIFCLRSRLISLFPPFLLSHIYPSEWFNRMFTSPCPSFCLFV